jgi:hypothetical protein
MDNLKDRGPRDRSRISLTEDWEVKYLSKNLAVSTKELKEAVHQAGHSVNDVREYLRKK